MGGNKLIKRYKIIVRTYNFGDHSGTYTTIQDTPPSDHDIINAILKSEGSLKYGTRDASVEEVYTLIKE
jgi:hypothetical protein